MKAFLDSSVLIPVFYGDHVHHDASRELFLSVNRKTACCGAHSLAEVYSCLTRMPAPHRTRGDEAMLFLTDIRERLSLITLTAVEQFEAIDECSRAGLVGGAIYDGLLARCALKAQAESIYSWNIRHYRQCGAEVEKRLRTP